MSITIIIIIAGIYIGVVALLFFSQSTYVYYPNYPGRSLENTPETIGLQYKDVSFETVDTIKIHGWFIPAPKARGTVLFCHGNAGNISHRLESIRRFYHLGLNTFIFDYRGYGQSEGRPSEKGTYNDVEAAWHYLISEEGVGEDDIIFFGRSLGGPIAAWSAQKHAPKMLILETTFTSVPDLAAEIYPYFPVRWLCRFRYDTASYLQNVHCPVFIIHSMNDEIVPLKHGHTLFEIAHEPKQLLEIKGSHNDVAIESRDRYERGLRAFISRFSLSHLD